MKTTALLIAFNRPDYVRKMVDALRESEVEILFVFKDGPRPDNQEDRKASAEIEDIIAGIDWPCDVRTNFLSNNLGCGYGPYSAISWAFQYVDELIVLEDDCIPNRAFFDFCTQMLDKYRDNPKVRHISGRSQFAEHKAFDGVDYLFSQYAPTLGWALWKRTWTNFDMQMRELAEFFRNGGFSNQFASAEEADFFNRRYRKSIRDVSMVFHIWDYQYGLHSRADGSLAIVPAVNLIDYIGTEGTHPANEDSEYVNLSVSKDFKALRAPEKMEFNPSYEIDYFKKFVREPNLRERIVNKLKSFF